MSIHTIIKKFALPMVVFASLFMTVSFATPAHALFENAKQQACKGANLSNENGECNSEGAATSLESTIANIINLLSIVVGVAAVILIIVNGLRFITANGDASSISSARNAIIYSLVGLVIVAFAQVIVRFILDRI